MRKAQQRCHDRQLLVRQEQAVSGIVVEQLAHIVDDVARDVCIKLGSGLPRSVYQAGLLNHLSQSGLTLEVEPSMLKHGENAGAQREIILVDGRLAIECILEHGLVPEMEEVYKCRLGLDVKARNHEMGLVVNFGLYTDNPDSTIH